ncbi:MAG: sugar transferase [Paludibacteraceae bacterium]|nr:sugar transferase [Paludibacteraceae bacterium]
MNKKKRRTSGILHFEYKNFLADVVNLIISAFLVLWLAPFNTEHPFHKYLPVYTCCAVAWLLFAWLFGRYASTIKQQGYFPSIFKAANVTVMAYAIAVAVFYFYLPTYSIWVLTSITLIFFISLFTVQSLYFAFLYASDPEDEVEPVTKREPKTVLEPAQVISEQSYQAVYQALTKWVSKRAYKWLSQQIDLRSSNTHVLATTTIFNIERITPYKYDTIVNVRSLNNIRGINKMFSMINEKLPDNGLYVGVFKDKHVKKQQILHKYPKGINWVFYTFYYFVKRVLPKLFLTKRLYYDITHGKRRVLSKTEVFGRLYYCGFEIVAEKKMDHYTYFVARRRQEPPRYKKRRYGPIISLNRVGKNGKTFKFYKARTMYPYSEFLQEYIYQKCGLQEGGKFTHDIRVSTAGRFMRRCWLDELPMILNLLKGDMKLVGVRPLSKHYFSLYSKELQDLRTQVKPGLLPPFYADMPKTLDEIQESELRYLKMCIQRGSFITDIIYIWKIFVNIVFKLARSH